MVGSLKSGGVLPTSMARAVPVQIRRRTRRFSMILVFMATLRKEFKLLRSDRFSLTILPAASRSGEPPLFYNFRDQYRILEHDVKIKKTVF
jgi:hypothetical protein